MRRKPDGLKSWEDVDRALLRIGQLDREVEAIEARSQGDIDRIKAAAVIAAKPLLQEKKLLELQMEHFARRRQEELKGKSLRLNFGTISFRRSTRIVIGKVAECLESLKRLGLAAYIRVKESPDRERLRDLGDDILTQVGARRVVEENVFGYEVDREKVQDAA